ncbi:MAG: aminotransferase V [Gemmatimonadetes bacterium]|nr:MAG: aminotransferase V [Gemmatimonadota bacterium]
MATRRHFLRSLFAAGATLPALKSDALSRILPAVRHTGGRSATQVAADEDFWREIQAAFDIDRGMINLNNGGVAPSPRVVNAAFQRYLAVSNQAPAITMWGWIEPEIEAVRRRLAANLITRNASEALEIVQLGLPLQRGDEVLTTTQDYPRMITTWKQRERRDGIVLKQITFPVPPPSQEDLARRIEAAITPRTKVIHFCHITNLTGQIFPVKQICQLGRSRGIEVIVDGAHAYAHFPFTHDELDCDYYGTSLHKWLTAPIGTGFLYVRRAKIAKIWPMMAAPPEMNENIRKFEEIGTHPAANHNAIVEALDFLDGIGPERKAARLRFLRDRWAKRLEKLLTPYDPAQSCGLASFTPGQLDVGKLTTFLFDRHRIIVTPIAHPEFNCLRITPNVYTTLAEIDRFSDVMEDVLRKGLPTS